MAVKQHAWSLLYCLLILLPGGFVSAFRPADVPPYLDPSQPIVRRVADLLARMTLEEKVGQINMPCVYMDEYGTDIPAKTEGVRKFVRGQLVFIGPGGGFFTLANEILRDGTHQQAEFFNQLKPLRRRAARGSNPG